MRSFFAYIFLLIFALPAIGLSFLGYQRYDDEGLFIYMARLAGQGVVPYRDYLLEYGPLFAWFNEEIFSAFGHTHLVSRVAASILITVTFLFVVRIARGLGFSFAVAGATACAWLYSSSAYFSESLHPGWYISLILSAQGLLICLAPCRKVLFSQAVLAVAVLGLKLHLGVFAACAVSFHYLVYYGNSWISFFFARGLLAAMFFALLFIVIPILPHYGLGLLSLVSLLPFGIALFCLLAIFLRDIEPQVEDDTRSGGSFLLFAIFPFLAFCLLLYIISINLYGFEYLYESLYSQPKRLYYQLYSTPIPYSNLEVFFTTVSLIAAVASYIGRRRNLSSARILKSLAVFLATTLCVRGTPASILGWGMIYFIYLESCRDLRTTRSAIFLLAISQIVHAFPLPAAQVQYATVLSWILVCDLLCDEIQFLSTSFQFSRKIVLTLILALLLPLFRPVVWKLRNLTGIEGGRIESNIACSDFVYFAIQNTSYAQELCQLERYISANSLSRDRLLGIPGFLSLNLLTNRETTSLIPAARWSYLPKERLDAVLDGLKQTKFSVIHVMNGRLYLEKEQSAEDGFDTRLYSKVQSQFLEVPDHQWLGDGQQAKYFKLYRNPNL